MEKQSFFKKNIFYVNLALLCILSFGAVYLTLPRFGILPTIPLMVIFALICGFLKLKFWLKAVLFAVFGYFLFSVYVEDIYISIQSAIVFSVISLLCTAAAKCFKTKKFKFILPGAVALLAAFPVYFYAMGNPFDAYKAKDTLNDYIENKYETGSFDISPVYYDLKAKQYTVDINGKSDVTNIKSINLVNGVVFDNYLPYCEYSLMHGTKLEITEVLREYFPNDTFTVEQDSISRFPDGKADIGDTSDYKSRMSFNIYFSSNADFSLQSSKVKSYLKAVALKIPEVNKLNFYFTYSGQNISMATLKVSLTPQSIIYRPLSSDGFTEYIRYSTPSMTFKGVFDK